MPKLLARTALAVAVLLMIAGCGDDDGDATPANGAEEPAGGTGDGGSDLPSSLEFVALDIEFERDEVEAAAGELEVAMVNEGAIEHSWVVEGHEDELRLYTQLAGETDEGTITLDAGDHTYYCDIPGHRDAGMEGTLTLR